jgi:membrane fusion protein, multidrug efflux system
MQCRLLLIPVLIALAACQSESAAPAGPPAAVAIPVKVVAAKSEEWVDSIQALGTAQANESVTITAKVTDTVRRINFADGDAVDAGQILIEMSDRAETAQLEEARAALKEAERQLTRTAESVQKGAVTKAQLDQATSARDQASARMRTLAARLDDKVIIAPFSGVLGFRMVSQGSLLTPGSVITTLDDVRTIKLDFSVPEAFLGAIEKGQVIAATTAAFAGRKFAGTVASIDSRVDPVTRAGLVRAMLPNADGLIKPGMLMTVNVMKSPRNAIVVPEIAISGIRDQTFAFRLKPDASVEQIFIKLGARHSGVVEVTEGLNAGDQVITEGLVRLRNGAKVKVQG